MYLAEIYSRKNDIETAIEILTKASDKARENAKIYAQLGNLFAASKNYEKAIFYYRQALEQNPNNHILSGEITRLKFIAGMHDDDNMEHKQSNENTQDNSAELSCVFSLDCLCSILSSSCIPAINFNRVISPESI